MLRRLMLMTAVAAAVGLANSRESHAQYYTVFIVNMARLNYKTPVYYSQVFRSGLDQDVNKSGSACLQSITSRVNQNKRNRTDYECFLVIATSKPTTTDRVTETCTLANVSTGIFGNWAGWIVYWVPGPGQGNYRNPYTYFRAWGPGATPGSRRMGEETISASLVPTVAPPTARGTSHDTLSSPASVFFHSGNLIASNDFTPLTTQPIARSNGARGVIRPAAFPRSTPFIRESEGTTWSAA